MKAFVYPRKIDHWRRKTAGLTLLQRGIYSELIDWYYSTGADLPNDVDELCRMIGATKRSERENVHMVINNPRLFTVDKDRLVQKMCNETLTFMTDKSSKSRASAHTRWSNNKDLSNANASSKTSEGNAIYNLKSINQDPIIEGKILISSSAIDRARGMATGWDVYYLENAFREFVKTRNTPKNPDMAFLAWIPKFTKGKSPN